MKEAKYLTFHEAAEPIRAPVPKFGGDPVWWTKPEWPLNPKNGKPLLFVGQAGGHVRAVGRLPGPNAWVGPAGDKVECTRKCELALATRDHELAMGGSIGSCSLSFS